MVRFFSFHEVRHANYQTITITPTSRTHAFFFAPASTYVTKRVPPQIIVKQGEPLQKSKCIASCTPVPGCVRLVFFGSFVLTSSDDVSTSRFVSSEVVQSLALVLGVVLSIWFSMRSSLHLFSLVQAFSLHICDLTGANAAFLNKTYKGCWISEDRPLKVTLGRHEARTLIEASGRSLAVPVRLPGCAPASALSTNSCLRVCSSPAKACISGVDMSSSGEAPKWT